MNRKIYTVGIKFLPYFLWASKGGYTEQQLEQLYTFERKLPLPQTNEMVRWEAIDIESTVVMGTCEITGEEVYVCEIALIYEGNKLYLVEHQVGTYLDSQSADKLFGKKYTLDKIEEVFENLETHPNYVCIDGVTSFAYAPLGFGDEVGVIWRKEESDLSDTACLNAIEKYLENLGGY